MADAIPAVLLRYIDGLKRHDVAQISATVADDAAIVTPVRTLAKPQFLAFLTALYAAFPDWRYDHDAPEALTLAGSFRVRWRQGGTHAGALVLPDRAPIAATGKVVRIPEQEFFYKLVNDRLIEIRPDAIAGGAPWGILEQLSEPPV